MVVIGITGGIGSGKSTICKLFNLLGIPVYNADQAAKALMTSNETLKKQLVETFGANVFEANQQINRAYLANLVFNHPEKLAQLNQLVHPAVLADFKCWIEKQNAPYVVKEAALLFESESYKQCKYTILVESPMELRLERIMRRDKSTKEQIQARIQHQLPDAEKAKLADYLLLNDEKNLLIPQVMALHQHFIEQAKA